MQYNSIILPCYQGSINIYRMESKILKYFRVNMDGYPVYIEVREVCPKHYLCFFSTLYNDDEFFIEDKYGTFGFKVIEVDRGTKFIVYGKLTVQSADIMWSQIRGRLNSPDNEINFYSNTVDTMAIANFKL
jgi:hypothetical protein